MLGSQVKDCYIMPLGKEQELPEALLPLEGQGLPPNRPNLLLSILVPIQFIHSSSKLSSVLFNFDQVLQSR